MTRRLLVARRLPVAARVTVVATAMLAVALVAGAVLFQAALRRAQVRELDASARTRLDATVALVQAGAGEVPSMLPTTRDSPLFVQVLDATGKVLGATPNVSDMHAIAEPVVGAGGGNGDGDGAVEREIAVDGARSHLFAESVATPAGPRTVLVAAPVRSVSAANDSLRRQLWVSAPLVLLGAALVTALVARRALRPVDVLRREVDAISAADLQRRVSAPPVDDEVSRLAHTMNALLGRLEEASARQARFVSDASHELRSPLAAVHTRLEVALRARDATDWPVVAEQVLRENMRMERLVEDLLLLSRADGGQVLRKADVDLDDVVLLEVENARLVGRVPIDASGVSGGRVVGDADGLRRVVANLLDNAQRHARTHVAVSLRTSGSMLELRVVDDGPGIPATERAKVFERFGRVDDARARREGGAGLGLAIVAELVRLHGGTVTVEDGLGGGAALVVRLLAA